MRTRSAYIARHQTVHRLQRRMIAGALAAVVASTAALFWRPAGGEDRTPAQRVAAAAAAAPHAAPAPAAAPAPRRVYPYSIVPGGVDSPRALALAVQRDRVVAQHYASFSVAQARAVAVTRPRAVHVSYRKGDKVYWTAGKVMLAAGETVLTDGHSEIRGRCGNRMSDVPQLPVAAAEPSAAELDSASDAPGELRNVSMPAETQDDGLTGAPFALRTFATHADAAPAGSTRSSVQAPLTLPGGIGMGPASMAWFPVIATGGTTALPPDVAAITVPALTTPDAAPAAVAVAAAPPPPAFARPTAPATAMFDSMPPITPAPGPESAALRHDATPPSTTLPVAAVAPPAASADAPEPATLWLAILAFILLLRFQRPPAPPPARDKAPHASGDGDASRSGF